MKNHFTIGISSMIFIFMVLCLSVFSFMSLSEAASALNSAKRRAESVERYYEADAIAQKYLHSYRNSYPEATVFSDFPDGTIVRNSSLGHETTVICEIPMSTGQTLYLEHSLDGSEILSYYVYNNSDYVIDSNLPVWDGN